MKKMLAVFIMALAVLVAACPWRITNSDNFDVPAFSGGTGKLPRRSYLVAGLIFE